MKPSGILGALAIGALFAFSAHAQAESVLMVTMEWPPFRVAGEQGGGWSGIDIDLMREVSRRAGIETVITEAPWSRCLEMIRLGHADLMTGVAWTAERAAGMTYVPTSYASVQPVFYARSGNGAHVSSYESLYGKAIGNSVNTAYFDRFNGDEALTKIPLKDEMTKLKMLTLGRIDLAIGTDPNFSWYIERFGMKGLVEPTAWQPAEKTPLYIVVSPASKIPNLAARLDEALRSMIEDGSLAGIQNGYPK